MCTALSDGEVKQADNPQNKQLEFCFYFHISLLSKNVQHLGEHNVTRYVFNLSITVYGGKSTFTLMNYFGIGCSASICHQSKLLKSCL